MNNKQNAFLTTLNGPVVSAEGFVDTLKDTLAFLGITKAASEKGQSADKKKQADDYDTWTTKETDKVVALEKALRNVTEVRKLPLKEGPVEGRFVTQKLYGDNVPFSVVHQRLTMTLAALRSAVKNYGSNLAAFKKTMLSLADQLEAGGVNEVNFRKKIHSEMEKVSGIHAPLGIDPNVEPMLPDAVTLSYWADARVWQYGGNSHGEGAMGALNALQSAEVIAAGKLITQFRTLGEDFDGLPDPCPDGTIWGWKKGTSEYEKVDKLIDFIHDNCDEDSIGYNFILPRLAHKYGWAVALNMVYYDCQEVAETLLVWIFESINMSDYEVSSEALIAMESWFGFGGKDGPDKDVKKLLELLKANDVKHEPVGDQAIANLGEKLGYKVNEGVAELYRYVGAFRSESGESPLVVHDSQQTIAATEKLLKVTKQFKDPVVFGSTFGGGYIYIAAGGSVIEAFIDEEDGELNIQGRHSGKPAKFLTGDPADKQWR